MNVEWRDETWANGTSKRTIIVSRSSDWSLFDRIARELGERFRGTWSERLDGLDERYWDLDARGGKITLHLQHYLGISVSMAHGLEGHPATQELLEETIALIQNHDPD